MKSSIIPSGLVRHQVLVLVWLCNIYQRQSLPIPHNGTCACFIAPTHPIIFSYLPTPTLLFAIPQEREKKSHHHHHHSPDDRLTYHIPKSPLPVLDRFQGPIRWGRLHPGFRSASHGLQDSGKGGGFTTNYTWYHFFHLLWWLGGSTMTRVCIYITTSFILSLMVYIANTSRTMQLNKLKSEGSFFSWRPNHLN